MKSCPLTHTSHYKHNGGKGEALLNIAKIYKLVKGIHVYGATAVGYGFGS